MLSEGLNPVLLADRLMETLSSATLRPARYVDLEIGFPPDGLNKRK
jgi:hypothetical protein